MRARLLVLSAATVAITAALTSLLVKHVFTHNPLPPRVEYPQAVDLGPRPFGEIVDGRFRITNTGGSLLEVQRFRTSCSCAGVEAERDGVWHQVDKARIGPGESMDLTLRIAVGAPAGSHQTVQVYFDTNDPNHETAALEVMIPLVTSELTVSPKIISFGELERGESVTRAIVVFDSRPPSQDRKGGIEFPGSLRGKMRRNSRIAHPGGSSGGR
jgi:hypothetical protein